MECESVKPEQILIDNKSDGLPHEELKVFGNQVLVSMESLDEKDELVIEMEAEGGN